MSPVAPRKKSAKRTARKPRTDPNRVITDAILDQLRQGVAPWRCPWARTGGLPVNLTTGNAYRGANVLMFMLGGWGDRHWLTFNQARTLGGTVRKGEKGTPAVRWVESTTRLTPAEVTALKAAGANVQYDQDGPYIRRVGPVAFVAFNVLQVDGIERPDVPPTTWNPDERAEEVLQGLAAGPQIIDGGDRAQYRHATDSIHVPDRGRFTDSSDYYHAAFHELIHATGAPTRLARDLSGEFGTATYAREELVAEIGAAMLCAAVGLIPPIQESASYIAGWLKELENDHKLVIRAAQAAQKAVDLILQTQAAQ